VPPGEVTVESAVTDVARGLASFNQINKANGINSGLLVDELTVNLKLAASATDSSKLVVDLARPTTAIGLAGRVSGNSEFSQGSNADLENTVQLKFKNINTAALNDVGKKKAQANEIPTTTFSLDTNKVDVDCSDPRDAQEFAACVALSK
jgi:hypothetical protein